MKNNKRIHIVFATTIFAALLWFSLSMRENYQLQISAPLIIQGLPPGKEINSPVPSTVQLTFNDIGWRLAKIQWGSNLSWNVDLSAMQLQRHEFTVSDFVEELGASFGSRPIAMKPETFTISLDTLATTTVMVSPAFAIEFREGYGQVGPALLEPESVVVSGAASVLRSIHSWPTVKKAFAHVRESIDMSVPLADTMSYPLTFTPTHVKLRINVQQFAEKTIMSIPIELVSVPQNREVLLSERSVDLVVRGGIDQLAALNQSTIRATVDYRVILADTSGVVEPQIAILHGIQIVKRTPERINYVVRKN